MTIPREALEKYSQQPKSRNGAGADFNMEAFLAKHGFEHSRKNWNSHSGGEIFELSACPFDPNHTGGSAAFTLADGVPGFACKHNGCQGKTITDVFKRYPPERSVIFANPGVKNVIDMPESVLDGRLGELCKTYLCKLSPMTYAWPALLAVAGTLAHQTSKLRTNLFVTLVGDVGTGKTATVENALALFGLNDKSTEINSAMAGSAEGFFKNFGDASGCARLYWPDELKHLFLKMQIEGSTFAQVLQRAYYSTTFDMVVAKGKKFPVNVSLGIVGGVVNFEECYNSATLAGLYDRTTFGLCPEPFRYEYAPFESVAQVPESIPISVHPEVWSAKNEWLAAIPGMTGRVAENALRAASICASFDGKSPLRATDLAPALEFAKYQIRFRELKQPNPGMNPDAVCAYAILRKLGELAPNGELVRKREILKAIHGEKFGPGVFRRAGENLFFNGEIEYEKIDGVTKKIECWRLAGEDQPLK